MDNHPAARSKEPKTIVTCAQCLQRIRIPRRRTKICVTCPKCRYEFVYQYYGLGFSSLHRKRLARALTHRLQLSSPRKKRLVAGLLGSLPGVLTIELVMIGPFSPDAYPVIWAAILIGTFAAGLSAAIETAGGFSKKHRRSLRRALKASAGMGLIGGIVSGVLGQLLFGGILSIASPHARALLWSAGANAGSSLFPVMLARTVSWSIMGSLLGLSFAIDKASGDLKPGLVGGLAAGAAGGLLFDPLSSLVSIGAGTLSRLLGFSLLGTVLGGATFRFKITTYERESDSPAVLTKEPVSPASLAAAIKEGALAAPILVLLGFVVWVVGVFLVAGNITGAFPTFPFAGFLTTGAGVAMIDVGMKM